MLILDLTGGISWDDMLIIMLAATICGVLLSLTFMFTHKKQVYDKTFIVTLILLPLVISSIITLVAITEQLAIAFSLAGVFALVRFRTSIADPRDITYVLSTVAIALACSLGLLGLSFIITIFICFIFLVLYFLKADQNKVSYSKLQIVIAENVDYTSAFKDIFEKYLSVYELKKVKTIDFGSLFELTYLVKIKNKDDQKLFIDDLRSRNSNLNITLVNEYAELLFINNQ